MKKTLPFLCLLVVVLLSCEKKPVANFSYDCGGACLAPVIVNFSLESENADKVLWDFGDGETSNMPSAMHEYTQPGTYEVTLTVFNGDHSDEITKEIVIEEPASRLLVQELKVLTFPNVNPMGESWDTESGASAFPDLYVTFTGSQIDELPNLREANFTNTPSGPIGWTFNPAVDLGDMNETYRVILKDKDVQGDEIVGYAEFSPSEFITRKYYPSEIEIYRNSVRFRLFVEWR